MSPRRIPLYLLLLVALASGLEVGPFAERTPAPQAAVLAGEELLAELVTTSTTSTVTGEEGPTGHAGPSGEDGSDGGSGTPGPTGPIGPTGATGPAGPAGMDGRDGATGATGARGPAATEHVYLRDFTGEAAVVTPGNVRLWSGEFTPVSDRAILDADVVATMTGSGHFVVNLFYGSPSLAPLHPDQQDKPLKAGVRSLQLGSIPGLPIPKFNVPGVPVHAGMQESQPVGLRGGTLLTGLTPGKPVRWELVGGVVGNADPIVGRPGANRIDVSEYTDRDGYLWGVVRNDSDNSASVVRVGNAAQHPVDDITATVALPQRTGGDTGGVAMRPDGTRAVVVNQLVNSVSVIEPRAGRIQGTYALPDAGANPHGVVMSRDGTKAYVVGYSTGKLYPLNVSAGTWGTAIPIATAGSSATITRDGQKVIVTHAGPTNAVSLVTLSDRSVVRTALGGSANDACTEPGGGAVWVTLRNTAQIVKVSTANGALLHRHDLGAPPTACGVMSDGFTLMVTSDVTGTEGMQIQQFNLPSLPLVRYTKWPNWLNNTAQVEGVSVGAAGGPVKDLALTPFGGIMAVSANGITNSWYGGRFRVRPGGFHNELMRIRVQGAE